MNRRNSKDQAQPVQTSAHSSDPAADLFSQMQTLQRELLLLSQRAQAEVEASIVQNPAPVIEMLENFAQGVNATAGCVWFDAACIHKREIPELTALELLEADKEQCGLALSGREMAFDFVNARIFFPIVVFDNPLAVAVLDIPGLSCSNYETVCRHASLGISSLRSKLRRTEQPVKNHFNAAS